MDADGRAAARGLTLDQASREGCDGQVARGRARRPRPARKGKHVSSTTDTAAAATDQSASAPIGSGGGPEGEPPYAAIQALYAQQAWDLDRGDAEGFAATFTADSAFEHLSSGEVLRGPAQIAAALRRTAEARRGAVYRHWFAQLWLDPVDADTLNARYYAIVSVTDAQGAVAWDPSCVVEDELVRAGGRWLTRRRVVRRDDLLLR